VRCSPTALLALSSAAFLRYMPHVHCATLTLLQFNHTNGLSLIARAHQLVQEGYKLHFDGLLATVWSAPNYCYRCGNAASILTITADGERRWTVFDAAPENERDRGMGVRRMASAPSFRASGRAREGADARAGCDAVFRLRCTLGRQGDAVLMRCCLEDTLLAEYRLSPQAHVHRLLDPACAPKDRARLIASGKRWTTVHAPRHRVTACATVTPHQPGSLHPAGELTSPPASRTGHGEHRVCAMSAVTCTAPSTTPRPSLPASGSSAVATMPA
jgi:hypothetical protein